MKMSGNQKVKVYRNTSNKIFGEHMQHTSIKIMCNWEISRFSRAKQWHCSRAKQRQRNVQKGVGHLPIFFSFFCRFFFFFFFFYFFFFFFCCFFFFFFLLIRSIDFVAVLIAVAVYHRTILFFVYKYINESFAFSSG